MNNQQNRPQDNQINSLLGNQQGNPLNSQPTATPGPTVSLPNKTSSHLTQKMNPDDLASLWRRTKCLNCGYVYEGAKILKKCPKCGNSDPDKFRETD